MNGMNARVAARKPERFTKHATAASNPLMFVLGWYIKFFVMF
jgi:hypothetical protein